MKNIPLLLLLLAAALLLPAHEFWLQATKYRLNTGEESRIDVRVGESYAGELWNYRLSRVEQFKVYEDAGGRDVSRTAREGAGDNLRVKFDRPGTKLIALETNSAHIKLAGEKFNDYLLEDGLYDALRRRNTDGLLADSASENYARNIKTLLQVGNRLTDAYATPVGMPLEIIPLQHPYALKDSASLDFRLLYRGQPAAGLIVLAWHKWGDEVTQERQLTDSRGRVRFPVRAAGVWMISSVTMVPSKKEDVDWQSYWASLTFGYD
ncbi:MAG: DUF4198 domain-containing protein [Saprospiraceae bacterium]